MDLNALYPAGGNHAIQNVAFVFEWPTPASDGDIAAVREVHRAHLSKSFPTVQTPQLFTFNIQPGIGAAPMAPQLGSGLILQRNRPGPTGSVVSASIQVNPQNCVIFINDYTRWDTIWGEVSHWISLIMPPLLNGRPLTVAALQYTDAFEWRGDPPEFNGRVLFSPDSTYIPRNGLSNEGLWHSHHGFFVDVAPDVGYKLLENVNINLNEEPGSLKRSAMIVTSHKATFDSPLWRADEVINVLNPVMATLHERNKAILKDLLLEEVQRKIKLFGDK